MEVPNKLSVSVSVSVSVPTATVFIAGIRNFFSKFLSQNYVRNVIFTVYLRLLILLCLSLYCRCNVIVNKAANTY